MVLIAALLIGAFTLPFITAFGKGIIEKNDSIDRNYQKHLVYREPRDISRIQHKILVSFDTFRKWYRMNADEYLITQPDDEVYTIRRYVNSEVFYFFFESKKDYHAFKKWYNSDAQVEQDGEDLDKWLAVVQGDIDAAKEAHLDRMSKAEEEFKATMDKLKADSKIPTLILQSETSEPQWMVQTKDNSF